MRGNRYQQTCENAGGAIGWFDFFHTVLEMSATALLDVQSDPGIEQFNGVEHVNIIDYMDADSIPAMFHPANANANTTAVVTVNCSQTMCHIDGFTLSGAAALGRAYDHSQIHLLPTTFSPWFVLKLRCFHQTLHLGKSMVAPLIH